MIENQLKTSLFLAYLRCVHTNVHACIQASGIVGEITDAVMLYDDLEYPVILAFCMEAFLLAIIHNSDSNFRVKEV